VFVAPELFDTYGNKKLNETLRNFKDVSLRFGTGGSGAKSLFESVKNNASSLIEKMGEDLQSLKSSATEKMQQVKETSKNVENAYNALQEAKKSLDKLTGTGTPTPQK
jgi:seryl-tRNA synthetase